MHNRRRIIIALSCLSLTTCKSSCQGDGAGSGQEVVSTPGAADHIAAHTAGEISRFATVKVRFHESHSSGTLNEPLSFDAIELSPEVEGQSVWSSEDALEFRPNQPLKPGQSYEASVDLEALGVGMGEFNFRFSVVEQAYSVNLTGLSAASDKNPKQQIFEGVVTTADTADAAEVEELLTAKHRNDKLQISWEHNDTGMEHRFTITGIKRRADSTELKLTFDGDSIGVAQKQDHNIDVPGLNNFVATGAEAMEQRDKYIALRFSDPLKRKQNLKGLITVEGKPKITTRTQGSVVHIYSGDGWDNEENVTVHPGIKNVAGYAIREKQQFAVTFQVLKPAVEFVGKGTVVPSSQGLTLPVKVANVRAIVVEAMRIPTDNLSQFYQVNSYNGQRELQRVGRVVWRDVVALRADSDPSNRWRRYGLDLTPLTKTHPSGMYRLRVSFRPQDITYDCPGGGAPVQDLPPLNPSTLGTETSFWDYAEDYATGMTSWELYEHRDDPCHPGYYRSYSNQKREASRNVLLTDIGVIAKLGRDGSLLVATTNLKTAKPWSGVSVSAYDFQRETLATASTNSDGLVELPVGRIPFLVVAQADSQTSFVRMAKGESLAVGHFDVSGSEVKGGLQGFFYGERGVWRPGDTLYLTFVLRDAAEKLPGNHPVNFELRDPRGQVVERRVHREGINGVYVIEWTTDPDALTGEYVAVATVGGAEFTKTLSVETVVPNRLKIEMDFGEGAIEKDTFDAKLHAAWLHGAKASNLKFDVSASLSPRPTTFSKFSEYTFEDPSRRTYVDAREVASGYLDASGDATVNIDLPAAANAGGMLTASFKTRVYEPNDAFSVDRHAVPFSPYERYVGIRTPKGDAARGMLLTDTKHTVDIVAVNKAGNPRGAGNVELALYKINWRWWWEKGEESLPDYAASSNYTPVAKGKVSLNKGRGSWQFEVKHPAWGRYLLLATDKKSGHRSGKIVYIDWPGWAGRAQKDNPGGANVLSFATDKKSYNVGEMVNMTIPTPMAGRALVSIENGTRVLQAQWIEAQGDSAKFQVKATPNMTPTAYAHVTLVQPHLHDNNDLPIRMYGIVPIEVIDPKTRIEPKVALPGVIEPESTTKIKVSEAKGQPMTYTLALVDEGLLGLTRFDTPNPWDHFYQRHALGVSTWDFFDEVAGAYGGELERLLAVGGGEEADDGATDKANRFPPMVHFSGPHELGAGDTATHEVPIPQYVGAVRAMVVASSGTAYGSAEKSVFVRKPLMVLATLPRVVGPGEEIDLPVSVFALEDGIKNVSVSVKATGPMAIDGDASKVVTFASPGDKVATFAVKIPQQLGVARVTINASAGKHRATQTIEIDVRHPNLPQTNMVAKALPPGETWAPGITFTGIPNTNTATLELSSVPPLSLESRMQYLIGFPHGCAEQTTSKAFPQLYLSDLIDLTHDEQEKVKGNVQAALDKLTRFQQSSGGFAYWPGQHVNDWTSSYIGHFILEAKNKGYALPEGMLSRWKKHQQKLAGAWSAESDARYQAYRLYTLALAGNADIGAMNRLRQDKELKPLSTWLLAGAYAMAGQKGTGKQLAARAEQIPDYKELSGTFGSSLRDRGLALAVLVDLEDWEKAATWAKGISEELSKNNVYSTHSTAMALIGMARYATAASLSERINATYAWAGDLKTVAGTKRIAKRELQAGKDGTLTVTNKGDATLFAQVVTTGLPKVGDEVPSASGLALTVTYQDPNGGSLDPTSIAQGADFVVSVRVKHTGTRSKYQELSLSHLIPSGWEIQNERLTPGARIDDSNYDYQDVRDDRVYTYFDLKKGEEKTFKVMVHAAYLGRYYLPMVSVEAMYDAQVNAQEGGQWVQVIDPGAAG